jgi:lysophospholipase L1-like esterase
MKNKISASGGKTKKIFQLITSSFLLLNLFLAFYSTATAQTVVTQTQSNQAADDYSKSGVSNTIKQFLCTPTEPGQQPNMKPPEFTGTISGDNTAAYDLTFCIQRLYKFSIVFASVVAVFFIVMAGYIYMSADGSSESVDKAKSILQSSITALVILMGGYVLLRAINPDLITIPSIQPPNVVPIVGQNTTGGTGNGGTLNSSVCAPNRGSCNVSQMQQCGAWDANVASGICGQESSGVPTVPSHYDHCVDNTPFTIGLFQINIINSAKGVAACPAGIFVSSDGQPVQSHCMPGQRDSSGICHQWNCQLAPGMQTQYQQCVNALSDPATNIGAACALYQSRKWSPWQNSYNKCVQPATTSQTPSSSSSGGGGGVLLLGDSLMVGMQSSFTSSAQGAGTSVNSNSSAVSGAGIQQITQTVNGKTATLSSSPPDVAFVSLGTNNFSNSSSQIQSSESQMLSALNQIGVKKIIWIGPPKFPQPNASNISPQQNEDLNNALKNGASGACYYDTYNSGLQLYSGSATDIHPGSSGYQTWSNAIWNWYKAGNC